MSALSDLEKWWLGLSDGEAIERIKDLKTDYHDFYLRGALAACSKKAWDKFVRLNNLA